MIVNPKNCLLILRIRDEEKLLNRFLHHNEVFFDSFIVVIDRCTDSSYNIVKQHPKCACVIEKIKDSGYDLFNDDSVLTHATRFYNYEWIWRLDVDELVCHSFLDEMNNIPESAVSVGMHFLSLFPDENHFISGNHIYSNLFIFGRLFKRIEMDREPQFNTCPIWVSNSLVYHYHMISQERRNRRYQTYLQENPELINDSSGYDHIIHIENIRYTRHNGSQTKAQLIDCLSSNAQTKLDEYDAKQIQNRIQQSCWIVPKLTLYHLSRNYGMALKIKNVE